MASRRPDSRELRRLGRQGENLVPEAPLNIDRSTLVEFLPLQIPTLDTVDTYDVPENRLVKYFLYRILGEHVGLVANAARKEIERIKANVFHYESDETKIHQLENVIESCAEFHQRLNVIQRKYPFLQDVGRLKTTATTSLVLQRERSYREFYRVYLDFMKKRARLVYSDSFFMTIKEIQELYEMCCLLMIIELCREIGYKVTAQNLFQSEELKFTYRLISGSTPIVTLKKQDAILDIFYKKEYNQQSLVSSGYGSMGETHIPDISLELRDSPESSVPKVLVFDAKYREYDPQIIDKLAAYKHDIGGSAKSIVVYALALWIDRRAEYRLYLLPARTGGIYFVPKCDFSAINEILRSF